MTSIHRRLGAVLIAGLFAFSACGGSGSSLNSEQQAERTDAIEEMVADGVERGEAECFVDGSIDEFGARIFDDEGEPTNEEIEKIFSIMDDCGIEISDL